MEKKESALGIICSIPRNPANVLKFIQLATDDNFNRYPESNLSFWVQCFSYAQENGYSDERVEQVLRLNSFKKSNKISMLQHLGFAVYTRLSNALQVVNLREKNNAPPLNKSFLDSITTVKVEFFDFINAGLFVMQPTETACIGGEKFCVIKRPDSEILNLNGYRNLVREASLELFQADPPYRDLLDNLMGGFSKEVLPQLGLEVRHE